MSIKTMWFKQLNVSQNLEVCGDVIILCVSEWSASQLCGWPDPNSKIILQHLPFLLIP